MLKISQFLQVNLKKKSLHFKFVHKLKKNVKEDNEGKSLPVLFKIGIFIKL